MQQNGVNHGTSAFKGEVSNRPTQMGGGAGRDVFVLSTEEVDRHGDVVSVDGWRLESYRRNPVLLWAHDYRRPAIGRALSVWSEPGRLLAQVEFAPGAFAQEVAALYEAGFQWGVSVGFRPIRWEERRDDRSGAFLGIRFLEQELLEVSAVPVPANRQALRVARRATDTPCDATPAGPDAAWHTIAVGALLSELEGAARDPRLSPTASARTSARR